jgi:hypothetical protein
MKKCYLIAFCVFGFGAVFGQKLSPQVTASSGDNFSNQEASLSWTIGECMTEPLTSTKVVVSQGFQQNEVAVTPSSKAQVSTIDAKIFPNPTSQSLKVVMKKPEVTLTAVFVDMKGINVITKPVAEAVTEFDISNLPKGNYMLNITTSDGKSLGSYKIIKN